MSMNVHRILVKLTVHDWPPIMINSSDYNSIIFHFILFHFSYLWVRIGKELTHCIKCNK
jgi:hypothetical protein